MDIDTIIKRYFAPNTESSNIYHQHTQAVASAVVKICEHNSHLNISREFAVNAALLHDIGVCMVHAPKIHCYGFAPYIQHGIMGRIILEDERLSEYALVCERHIGTGFFKDEIIDNKLPLPIKDMFPISLEEKVVAFADKFFSKSQSDLAKPDEINVIREEIAAFGKRNINTFNEWCELFGYEYLY